MSRPSPSRNRYATFIAVVVLPGMLGACGEAGTEAPLPVVEPLVVAAGPDSAQPHLATGPTGDLVLSWQERGSGTASLRYSSFDGSAWSEPRTVASGENWFVNWADFPSVVPVGEELWAAHWLVKREGGTYAYDVAVAVSGDAGATWSPAITPHTDGTATEHGFVSLFPLDGKAGALWLDGRNTDPDGGHDHGGSGAMTLRSAAIGHDLEIAGSALADERVCDCCQTDVALAGTTPVAVYRNRSDGEIRDIFVARLEEAGWTTGEAIADDGWEIAGCPVNGPAIDASDESVAVAWFTAADNKPTVRYARSTDGGTSFGRPLDIAAGSTLGRVDVILLGNGGAIVSHLDNAGDGTGHIVLRQIAADGTLAEPLTVATTAAGRMSGFPQLARNGNRLVLAWTDVADGKLEVRSATVSLSPGM